MPKEEQEDKFVKYFLTYATGYLALMGLIFVVAAYYFTMCGIAHLTSPKFPSYTLPKNKIKLKQYDAICQSVLKKFDKNKNQVIDYQEGLALSRAVGFNEPLPNKDLIFRLNPDYSDIGKIVLDIYELKFRNPRSYDKTRPYQRYHSFKFSKLRELNGRKTIDDFFKQDL